MLIFEQFFALFLESEVLHLFLTIIISNIATSIGLNYTGSAYAYAMLKGIFLYNCFIIVRMCFIFQVLTIQIIN